MEISISLPVSAWVPPSALDGTEVLLPFQQSQECSRKELLALFSWLIGGSVFYAADGFVLFVSSTR